MSKERKPHGFCEGTEPCTMNYCDENGCQDRKRNYVEGHEPQLSNDYQPQEIKPSVKTD